jgi:hypothetical protein
VNYRKLYFFHKQTAVISHGLTKEKQVPAMEVDKALGAKEAFEGNPSAHTFKPMR